MAYTLSKWSLAALYPAYKSAELHGSDRSGPIAGK